MALFSKVVKVSCQFLFIKFLQYFCKSGNYNARSYDLEKFIHFFDW